MNRDIIFREQKAYLMGCIACSRADLKLWQHYVKVFGKEWLETVQLERDYFQSLLNELVELKKWVRHA